jgi:hypothetical protein
VSCNLGFQSGSKMSPENTPRDDSSSASRDRDDTGGQDNGGVKVARVSGVEIGPDRTVLKVSKPRYCSITHIQAPVVVFNFGDGKTIKPDSMRRRSKPDPRRLDDDELKEKQQAADDKRQKEREQRTEAKRQRRQEQTGMDVSTEDIIAEEKREKQELRERGKASRDGMGQTRIKAFFKSQPQAETGDGASASQSEEITTALAMMDLSVSGDGGEHQVVAGVTPPLQPMKMFLRLAFLERAGIDKMKKTPAKEEIAKEGMIGPVLVVQSSVGSQEFTVDETKFGELNDISKRTTGKDVGRAKYAELKQELAAAGWHVHDKYLSRRAREVGNVDWTTPLLEAVVEAVKQTQSRKGTPQFQEARRMLAAQYSSKTMLGKLTVEQVKYGWGKMKDGGDGGGERESRKRLPSFPSRRSKL